MAKLSGNILIIDDERAIRSTLREILEYEDYVVEDVDNGIDGLELIEKNDYDLVLCDIKMNRMDGMEVLSEGLYFENFRPALAAYSAADTNFTTVRRPPLASFVIWA